MAFTTAWKPEYSVNVPELDQQHQWLFQIVQDLERAIAGGHGQAEVERILSNLVQYTMYHFATEEELLQKHGFPGVNEHRIEHNQMTMKISRLQDQHRDGKADAAETLLVFLQSWLKQHILESDKQYSEFFRSRAVGRVAGSGKKPEDVAGPS